MECRIFSSTVVGLVAVKVVRNSPIPFAKGCMQHSAFQYYSIHSASLKTCPVEYYLENDLKRFALQRMGKALPDMSWLSQVPGNSKACHAAPQAACLLS